MFGLIPREIAFFDLFRKAAHNMIEGSRLLKDMMENFQDPVAQAGRIKDVEHIGDGITHDIVKKLNQTFITPIDREDIHGLASVLDDPQFLVNQQALDQVELSFAAFGDQGNALFEATMTGVRTSFANGIAEAFFIAIFVLLGALAVSLFMKEVPLRRAHIIVDEAPSSPADTARSVGAPPALKPIEGGSGQVPD